MFDYLDGLRKRPEPERKRAVLKISLGVTIIIALVWGVFVYMRISHTDFSFDSKGLDREAPDLKAAFSNLVESIGETLGKDSMGTEASSSEGLEANSELPYPGLEALFSTPAQKEPIEELPADQ